MKSCPMSQIVFHLLSCNVFLMVIGMGLILGGVVGTAIGQTLWYWCDFRLWAWWLFGGVVIVIFLFTRRKKGLVEIVGILVCGVVILCRVDFDIGMYEEGRLLAMQTGRERRMTINCICRRGFMIWVRNGH